MNILFTFHYCSAASNDIAWAPISLATSGEKVLVVTARHERGLKGEFSAPEGEVVGGAEFYRPFPEWTDLRKRPFSRWREVEAKVAAFRPDVVIGFGEFNYRLPLRISRRFGVPLILYMEYLRPERVVPPLRGKRLLLRHFPTLYRSASRLFVRYLSRYATAIMFAYYGDQVRIAEVERIGLRAFYVPWCTDVGPAPPNVSRDRHAGIYIGSLAPFKNAAELVSAIPIILEQTPTERFIVIGPGPYASKIKELQRRYKSRLLYIPSVPRSEALHLLRSAGYGYTPVRDCGLGFIGDCWGTGTPLVTTHSLEGLVRPDRDALVARGLADLPRAISALLTSEDLYERYSTGGRERYDSEYSGTAAARRYREVLDACVSGRSGGRLEKSGL